MIRIASFAAAALLAASFAAPAQAHLKFNGISDNGLKFNGLKFNGLNTTNGVQDISPILQGITLPGGASFHMQAR